MDGCDSLTLRIINKGPDYFRSRMFNRSTGVLMRRRDGRSAVEILEASRLDYTAARRRRQQPLTGEVDGGRSDVTTDPPSRPPRTSACSAPPRTARQASQPLCDTQRNTRITPAAESQVTSLYVDGLWSKHDDDERMRMSHSGSARDDVDGTRTKVSSSSSSSAGMISPLVNGRCARQTSSSKRDIPTICTEPWSSDHHGSTSSLVRYDDITVRKRHRKVISRSRSDLTKRSSNGSQFSDFSAPFSRNSADLETFFNQMGLDRTVLDPMLQTTCQAQSTSSLDVLGTGSAIGSPWDARSWASDDSQRATTRTCRLPASDGLNVLPSGELEPHQPSGHPSIVERNARVIKWLCSMRKSNSIPGQQTDNDM